MKVSNWLLKAGSNYGGLACLWIYLFKRMMKYPKIAEIAAHLLIQQQPLNLHFISEPYKNKTIINKKTKSTITYIVTDSSNSDIPNHFSNFNPMKHYFELQMLHNHANLEKSV